MTQSYNSQSHNSQSYNLEETQEILQRALALRQHGEYSQTQLAEMAAELGIPPVALQQAQQEWLAQRDTIRQRQAFQAYRRRSFKAHLIPFIAVNTFLLLLNLITSPRSLWFVYPLLGWGLGVALHGASLFQTEGEQYDLAFEQWRKTHT